MSTENQADESGRDERLLDQVRRVMRVRRYSMIYTHVLQQGGQGVTSPLDDLGV